LEADTLYNSVTVLNAHLEGLLKNGVLQLGLSVQSLHVQLQEYLTMMVKKFENRFGLCLLSVQLSYMAVCSISRVTPFAKTNLFPRF